MRQIAILGAGKSSSHLIRHLVAERLNLNLNLIIVDIDITHLLTGYGAIESVSLIELKSGKVEDYELYIAQSYLTISMLPASMHIQVADLCLKHSSHLITPSYISPEMLALNKQVQSKNLIFLNELGFDPGIDHLTTMKIYDELVGEGGQLLAYKSYAGGLVAPRNDDNPWHYKFSWNPRNVILAGQGGEIKYKEDGEIHTLDYQSLFSQSETLQISNGQIFDAYANRDSLEYEALYGWKGIETILRGTLRINGFCEAWAILVKLGLTDDTIKDRKFKGRTYTEFYASFLEVSIHKYLESYEKAIREKLIFIGFEDHESRIERDGSAAEILQSILVPKWKLNPEDTDWVVMVHFFEYLKEGKRYKLESFFSLEGESSTYTAMSKTVGMPIAYAVEMILANQIKQRGVFMPRSKEIYIPLLKKLEGIGIEFKETIKEI
jgi:saccharopine dehydrogenase-like NADP-dependent oxidoreductase